MDFIRGTDAAAAFIGIVCTPMARSLSWNSTFFNTFQRPGKHSLRCLLNLRLASAAFTMFGLHHCTKLRDSDELCIPGAECAGSIYALP